MNQFRKLTADEIDVRVATVKKNGLSLLLYKDARVDQNILDETFGITGWQRSHQLIGDRLYCTVSIWDEAKQQWISKQDVGTESNTEAEKGQASDSFKRACFNLGIGRELYTAPFIWIAAEDCKITEDNGRCKCFDSFFVSCIHYDDKGRIDALEIKNSKTKKVVYSLGITTTTRATEPTKTDSKSIKTETAYPAKATMIHDLTSKLGGAQTKQLLDYWGAKSFDDVDEPKLQTAWRKYCN